MGLFTKAVAKHEPVTKVQLRAAGLPTHSLPDWAGQCLNTAAQSLRLYEQTADPALLEEGVIAAEALQIVLGEMIRRREALS